MFTHIIFKSKRNKQHIRISYSLESVPQKGCIAIFQEEKTYYQKVFKVVEIIYDYTGKQIIVELE